MMKTFTPKALKLLVSIINFIGSWFQRLENKYIFCCRIYEENMNEIFEVLTFTKPGPSSDEFKNTCGFDIY